MGRGQRKNDPVNDHMIGKWGKGGGVGSWDK